jgi:chitodextrinase
MAKTNTPQKNRGVNKRPARKQTSSTKTKQSKGLSGLKLAQLTNINKKVLFILLILFAAVGAFIISRSFAGTREVIREEFSSSAANFTTVAGGTWSVGGGVYKLSNPAEPKIEIANANHAIHKISVKGDFKASVDFYTLPTSAAYNDAFLVFNWVDASNYMYASFNEKANDTTNGIFKFVNGQQTRVAAFNKTFAPGTFRKAVVTRTANTYVAVVDGNEVGRGQDANFIGGRIGVGSRNDTVTFDNLIVSVPADTNAPSVPTGLVKTAVTTNSISVSWKASTDDKAVTGYKVYVNGTARANTTSTSYTVSSLTAGTAYSIAVAAFDDAGNISAKSTALSVTTTSTVTPTGTKPSASNTGVPAGTSLTVHNGDMTITTAGTVIDKMDIRGRVTVKAPNVVIKRSIIRGLSSYSPGNIHILVYCPPTSCSGLRIEDSEIVPSKPTVDSYGVHGGQFTLNRVRIHSNVDNVVISRGDVTVKDSWLYDNRQYAVDPRQGGTPSHDDGIQIEGGSYIRINNTVIEGGKNAAIMMTQNAAKTDDVQVTNSWLLSSNCGANISDNKGRGPLTKLVFTNNKIAQNYTFGTKGCGINAQSATAPYVTATGNTWTPSGAPVTVNNK